MLGQQEYPGSRGSRFPQEMKPPRVIAMLTPFGNNPLYYPLLPRDASAFLLSVPQFGTEDSELPGTKRDEPLLLRFQLLLPNQIA